MKEPCSRKKIDLENPVTEEEVQQAVLGITVVHSFASTLVNRMQDLPADYAKLVNVNFWELI